MDEIQTALNRGTDMTEEEYEKQTDTADKQTENHGMPTGKKVTEATRHRRIQSNFYGTAVNIMLNIMVELRSVRAELEQIKEKLDAE